jgi:hypothetical protein
MLFLRPLEKTVRLHLIGPAQPNPFSQNKLERFELGGWHEVLYSVGQSLYPQTLGLGQMLYNLLEL